MEQDRIQLVVYAKKFNQLQKLSHYGHVIYLSRKMNYGCVYVNVDQKDRVINKLKAIHGIWHIEINPKVLDAVI